MTEPLTRLRQAVADEDDAAVADASAAARAAVEDAFKGRRLTDGSLLLERRARLMDALNAVDDAAAAGEWSQATAELAALDALPDVVARARELPASRARRRAGTGLLRNAGTVARKELVLLLQSVQGLVLFGILLLTFGLGLEAALGAGALAGVEPSVQLVWAYAHSLDFLSIPVVGILAGYGLLNEERTSGTMHFLASKPLTRTGIVVGKWLGLAGALAIMVGGAGLIVALVGWSVSGNLGDPGVVVGYVAATYLLTLSFASVALLASALLDRGAAALGAGFGAYALFGPVWQNVFLGRQFASAGEAPAASQVLVYLATPFTAWWNWTSELLGPRSEVSGLAVGEPWHALLVEEVERGLRDGLPFYASPWYYGFVLVVWMAASVALTIIALHRRDLA